MFWQKIQSRLWIAVPFWWALLYIGDWLLNYFINALPPNWLANGSFSASLVEGFIRKLGDNIGVLAVALAAAGKISSSLNKTSEQTVNAINKAASDAAQFVQERVEADVIPKLHDATRSLSEDVVSVLSDVEPRLRSVINEAIRDAKSLAPLQVPSTAMPASPPVADQAKKTEVDHWDKVRYGWKQAKKFLDSKINDISDGRKRRRYVGLSRYSYSDIIEYLWQDDMLSDEQRVAALDMQSAFFGYRQNYVVPDNIWHVFAHNYAKLTGESVPDPSGT